MNISATKQKSITLRHTMRSYEQVEEDDVILDDSNGSIFIYTYPDIDLYSIPRVKCKKWKSRWFYESAEG